MIASIKPLSPLTVICHDGEVHHFENAAHTTSHNNVVFVSEMNIYNTVIGIKEICNVKCVELGESTSLQNMDEKN